MTEEKKVYDWDDEIGAYSENDELSFDVIPEGEYEFKVIKFERKWYNGSAKLPACNEAAVLFKIGDHTMVKKSFYLCSGKSEEILSSFAVSIGDREKGQKARIKWNELVGKTGRCKIGHHTYEGTVSNEIKAFLIPVDTSTGW